MINCAGKCTKKKTKQFWLPSKTERWRQKQGDGKHLAGDAGVRCFALSDITKGGGGAFTKHYPKSEES